jgi:hypothetical protein
MKTVVWGKKAEEKTGFLDTVPRQRERWWFRGRYREWRWLGRKLLIY